MIDIKRKSILVSTVLILGLVAYSAPNRHPIPVGHAEDYWEYACGIELDDFDGTYAYAHWTGVFPKTDGWHFYYFQEHHGRHVFRVSPDALIERVPEVYSLLDHEIESSVYLRRFEDTADRKNVQRAECLAIKLRVGDDHALFLDEVSESRSGPIRLPAGQEEIDSFLAQWGSAKLYWATVLFEAAFLWFWWVFTLHRGAFGKLNGRSDLQIGFSPLLLFVPYYLGYAPYLFTYGPTGGIVYPVFAMIVSIPFSWFPFNPVEVWVLERLPQPLWHISQVPAAPMAMSFWGAVSPTALLLFAALVLFVGHKRRQRRSRLADSSGA